MWGLDSELNQLRTKRFNQEKAAKASAKPIKDAESLDALAAGDVTWLDELSLLSAKLPPPEAVQVSELTAQAMPKGGGGQIKFAGYADTSQRVAELEDNLRDKRHTVSGKGTTQDPEREALVWTFDETLAIAAPANTGQAEAGAAAATAKTQPARPSAAAKATQGGGQ